MDKKPQLLAKEKNVAELQAHFEQSTAALLIDYRGISVIEDTRLRSRLREANISYFVAKNTMIKRASHNYGVEGLDPFLEGPTAIAFATDPVELAKVFSKFIKETKKTTIKAALLEKAVIDAKKVDQLAALPPKEVLLARVLGAMQSPMYGFAGVTTGMLRQLVTVTDKVREQKEQASA